MFKTSFNIGKIWGIPIKIHFSLILLLLILASIGIREEGKMAIPIVLLMQFLVFSSVLLHELGHSFVALKKGHRVREITLMFMGGVAQMESMPKRGRDELQLALAGPAVSLCLGITGTLFSYWLDHGFLKFAAYVLGTINFFYAGFNLIPAFPMDGGRVLRALLTKKYDRLRATAKAVIIGRYVALLFVLQGLFAIPGKYFVGPHSDTLLGNFFSQKNYMLFFVAIFIYSVGKSELRTVQAEELLRHRTKTANSFFSTDTQDANSGDRVLISPPPYKKGPAIETDIYEEKRYFR